MKRIATLTVLLLLVLLTAAACGNTTPTVEATDTPSQPQGEVTEEAASTSAPAAGVTAEAQAAPTKTPQVSAQQAENDPAPQAVGDTQIYLVALDAEPEGSADAIGCGDGLVPVTVELEGSGDPLVGALNELLSIRDEFYGQSGLYSALYQSDLEVAAVQYEGTTAIVALEGELMMGGTCDTPRVRAQLEQTALQFDGVESVEFLINGDPLNEVIAGEPVQQPTPGGPETAEQIFTYMVAQDDNGQMGQVFGCNDSLIPVLIHVDPTAEPLEAALRKLLNVQTEFYGQSGLYNALHYSELRLVSATVDDGIARIDLEGHVEFGGECDLPRFQAQVEQTVRQFEGVNEVQVFINGESLDVITGGGQGGGPTFDAQSVEDTVLVYLVAPDSGGGFGCGDSLIGVRREIDTPTTPLQSALEQLFSIGANEYQAAGLYNVFAQSDLTVDGADIEDGVAIIALSGNLSVGGTCDNPRVVEQIRATATQFDNIDDIDVTLNGEPLDDVLSLQ